ncbi:MAG: ScyD/ScyE family protein [Acidobacteriota bacterium]
MAAVSMAQTVSPVTSGLYTPNKLVATGNLLIVSEAGTRLPNTGRISIVDQLTGSRRTLVSGLPSAVSFLGGPAGDPDGPSGLALDGSKLYVTIGIGDAVIPGPGQGLETPNPGTPASPLFDSLLEITLPPSLASTDEYNMTAADHQTLAATGSVSLPGIYGSPLSIRLIANLPDYRPAPVPGSRGNSKASHIYGVETFNGRAYVVDSGWNQIDSIVIATGSSSVLAEFPNRPNPLFPSLGGPTIEAVPDAVHRAGNKLIVPLLTGFPFVPGLAEVWAIDLTDGTSQRVISGLTSAIDVLQVQTPNDSRAGCGDRANPGFPCLGDHSSYFTLEFSTSMLGGAPGRLRFYETPSSIPVDVAAPLITPTSMARNGTLGRIFITNSGPGTITSVSDH